MKKLFPIIALLAVILAAGCAGYKAGMNHVIYGAEIFAVEIPERNADGAIEEDEMTVYLEIDQQIHEYGCWIG